MTADYIKALMTEGRKFTEMPKDEALRYLRKQITTMYILNGLHRQMQPEAFSQEVAAAATAMYNELVADPLYGGIRDTEIPYIFSEGMKGRLGTDKDIVVTYKSLLRWIEGYLKHDERREAVRQIVNDRYIEPTRQITTQRTITDADIEKGIHEAYEAYVEWKQLKMQRKDGPQPLGVLAVPYLVRDLGGRKMEYLVRNGKAREGETFEDVLERARKNKGEFKKIEQ